MFSFLFALFMLLYYPTNARNVLCTYILVVVTYLNSDSPFEYAAVVTPQLVPKDHPCLWEMKGLVVEVGQGVLVGKAGVVRIH